MIRREEIIGDCRMLLGDCRAIMPALNGIDHIITDPPYSARTHDGHNQTAGRTLRDKAPMAELGYSCLTEDDADRLADLFCEVSNGWICWFSDHTLAPVLHKALSARGRYVFAPLACTQPGRSVRLTGDGPSSWTDWMTVARTKKLRGWGTCPGAYIFTAGDRSGGTGRIGSKPLQMMKAIVSDYSKPGETVLDPFVGSGTTVVACAQLGRRGIGIEVDEKTFDYACRRVEDAVRQPCMFVERPAPPKQEALF